MHQIEKKSMFSTNYSIYCKVIDLKKNLKDIECSRDHLKLIKDYCILYNIIVYYHNNNQDNQFYMVNNLCYLKSILDYIILHKQILVIASLEDMINNFQCQLSMFSIIKGSSGNNYQKDKYLQGSLVNKNLYMNITLLSIYVQICMKSRLKLNQENRRSSQEKVVPSMSYMLYCMNNIINLINNIALHISKYSQINTYRFYTQCNQYNQNKQNIFKSIFDSMNYLKRIQFNKCIQNQIKYNDIHKKYILFVMLNMLNSSNHMMHMLLFLYHTYLANKSISFLSIIQ